MFQKVWTAIRLPLWILLAMLKYDNDYYDPPRNRWVKISNVCTKIGRPGLGSWYYNSQGLALDGGNDRFRCIKSDRIRMSDKDSSDDLILPKFFKTPAGQQILNDFGTTLAQTLDVGKAISAAEATARKNNVPPEAIQLGGALDLLKIFGPLILQLLEDALRNKG